MNTTRTVAHAILFIFSLKEQHSGSPKTVSRVNSKRLCLTRAEATAWAEAPGLEQMVLVRAAEGAGSKHGNKTNMQRAGIDAFG